MYHLEDQSMNDTQKLKNRNKKKEKKKEKEKKRKKKKNCMPATDSTPVRSSVITSAVSVGGVASHLVKEHPP